MKGLNISRSDDSPFRGCKSVSLIHISKSTNSIGDHVFSRDVETNLKEIIIDDNESYLELGISGPQNGHYGCFSKAVITLLEKVYLGRNLRFKESSTTQTYAPFFISYYSEESVLKELYIGDYVTSLNGLDFSSHLALETLTIGKGLSTLPSMSSHSKLTSLTLRSEVPQKASAFTNSQYMTLKVYVPKGALAAYQSADVWKNFWNLQEVETAGVDDAISSVHDAEEVKCYDAAGRETKGYHKGLNIIKMSDGTTRKIIVK